jgi:hypothetical protein
LNVWQVASRAKQCLENRILLLERDQQADDFLFILNRKPQQAKALTGTVSACIETDRTSNSTDIACGLQRWYRSYPV